jgi:hypothetical protein
VRGEVQSVLDARGRTVFWVPFCNPIIIRWFLTLSTKKRYLKPYLGPEPLAEVFSNHLDAYVAGCPFFPIEFHRAQSLKIGEVLSELLSRESLLFVSRVDVA